MVDDAHLLDDTSAFMLQQLVDRRLARLVLTVCSGAAVSGRRLGAVARQDGSALDLQPLGKADCLTLLESVLDGSVDPVSERRLWSLTRGNVSFLRRIVEQEMCAGRLRRTDGTWTWLPGAVVPSSVCELIEHQMGDLTDAVADTVDLLSVAEPLTLRMLVDIVGREPVEQAEKRGLIIVDGRDEPVVRLAHPLYGEVRRLRAGHIRLRRLRGAVASRLEPEGDARHVLRRGTLQLESDIVSTAQDMLRAGEAALWSGDTGLALRFAQAAAAVGAGWRASIARADALHHGRGTRRSGNASRRWMIRRVTPGCIWPSALRGISICRAAPKTPVRSCGRHRRMTLGSLSAMHAFLDACGGDVAAATTAADAALQCPASTTSPRCLPRRRR